MLLVKESTPTPDIDQEELSYELDQMRFWLKEFQKDLECAQQSLTLFERHQAYAKELLHAQKP